MSSPSPARTVLVTGSAKRLGREIALTLARAGWQVAVHYRGSPEDAIETVAACTHFKRSSADFDADFMDETAVRGLLPRVIAHFGQVDAVVNCAALFEHDTAASFSFSSMEQHLRCNTGAAILLAQALHDHLAQRATPNAPLNGHGVVVNLLDQKLWNLNPDFFSYTLSKAAMESANTMLAMALAPLVRVVGVAPGLTLTSPLMTPEKFEALHMLAPLGRSSTPEDVAMTVKFAMENTSITGTTLLVDGGQHLMKFERDFSLM